MSEPESQNQPEPTPNLNTETHSDPQPGPEPSQEQHRSEPDSAQNNVDPEPPIPAEPEPEPASEIQKEPESEPKDSAAAAPATQAQLKKNDEGSRTFTMRELLSELKEGEDNESENNANSPYSQESPQQFSAHNSAALDLINSVTGTDEESQSRQRFLTHAAKKYATAIERNPDDYDSLYNWALVLQESADNVSPDATSTKDSLLEEACKKYDEATRICPTLTDAFYNWAIATADRAKMRGRTKEAEELWKQATSIYEKAIQLNWNSPQALNNWGLALQELSAIVPAREKLAMVKAAISKFRAAIQLQFDFHRAIYNLGTVLYGLAEDTLRTGGSGNGRDPTPNELYSLCAIYIAAAHALKPNYPVYVSALRLVRSMLPLPYFKVGYLTAPPAGDPLAPHSDWKRSQFLLDHEALQQEIKTDQKQTSSTLSRKSDVLNSGKKAVKVDIPDIVSVSPCADLTLPSGAGLCIDTIHGPFYFVADSWESLDGWLDAIRLVYTIYARGKNDVLAGIITS